MYQNFEFNQNDFPKPNLIKTHQDSDSEENVDLNQQPDSDHTMSTQYSLENVCEHLNDNLAPCFRIASSDSNKKLATDWLNTIPCSNEVIYTID